jgi:starch synthase
MSFIKGGLVFADWITTVSATYAKEIRTKQFGCGLEQLLEHRKHRLTGILNGVDYKTWSPGKDALIPQPYTARSMKLKFQNKLALQERFGLTVDPKIPVFAHVGRLEEQKGIDLVLAALPKLQKRNMQIIIVGTGQPRLEEELSRAAAQHPEKLGIHIGYDENLAHLLEAGADAFLMPSRFEPCGLNQMYSLRYGTLPIVRRTGGLADTVVDTTDTTLSDGTATGFVFRDASPQALLLAIERALALYKQPTLWNKVMRVAMKQDFSWSQSAKRYLELYQGVLREQLELRISA